MKKLFVVILLIYSGVSAFSQTADKDRERKYSLQVSPLLIVSNAVELEPYVMILGKTFANHIPYNFLIGFEFQYMINRYWGLSIEPRFGMGNDSFGFNLSFYFYGYGCNGLLLENRTGERHLLFTLNPGLLYKPFGTGLEGWNMGIYPTIGYKNLLMLR